MNRVLKGRRHPHKRHTSHSHGIPIFKNFGGKRQRKLRMNEYLHYPVRNRSIFDLNSKKTGVGRSYGQVVKGEKLDHFKLFSLN